MSLTANRLMRTPMHPSRIGRHPGDGYDKLSHEEQRLLTLNRWREALKVTIRRRRELEEEQDSKLARQEGININGRQNRSPNGPSNNQPVKPSNEARKYALSAGVNALAAQQTINHLNGKLDLEDSRGRDPKLALLSNPPTRRAA